MATSSALPGPIFAENAASRRHCINGVTRSVNGRFSYVGGCPGSLAKQLAKAMGAHVTAMGSAPNEAYVRSLGADDFIDYKQ